MARITLQDTGTTALMKVCAGNPGAITAVIESMRARPLIDPQCGFAEYGVLMDLDNAEIYGCEIYILWNDTCRRDVRLFIVVLRAWQMGFLPKTRLKEAASADLAMPLSAEELGVLDNKVCQQLPLFRKVFP